MITLKPSSSRGRTRIGWLDSYHSFSFGDYVDPANMGFGVLRVINDDQIAGGGGFGMHGHRDMEIVTVMISGALEHRDSLGNRGVLTPGMVQRMTAGSGIRHSEINASAVDTAHLLQIWLLPSQRGLTPSYEDKSFADQKPGEIRVIATSDGRHNTARIHTDANIYRVLLDADQTADQPVPTGRRAWIQIARGSLDVNGVTLQQGDAGIVSDETLLHLTGRADGTEAIVFDLA
jgi:hypothetical protein